MDRTDMLAALEAKVKTMIESVQQLRAENQRLNTELAAAQNQIAQAGEHQSAQEAEWSTVRSRIDQLLGELDQAEQVTGDRVDVPAQSASTTRTETATTTGTEPTDPAADPAADNLSSNPVLPGIV